MAVNEYHKAMFETMVRAIKNEDVAIMECKEIGTGEIVAVVVAMNETEDGVEFVPLAKLFNGNPYEELLPPKPDGGFAGGH